MDEVLDKIFRPEIVAKASPESVDPTPKALANEDELESLIERNTIAEFKEEGQDQQVS